MFAGRLRPVLVAAVLLAGLGVAGCGQENPRTHAKTEGPYLDVGPLQYQVQISRLLNPADQEDRAYFVGVERPDELRGEEAWFSVWVRVWNRTEGTHTASDHFEIEDTTGKRYEPVEVGAGNVFAYRPAAIPSGGTLPAADSAAEQSPIGGSMLLFRVTNESLANRPLILHIESPRGEPHEAEIDLDV
ncbi:MAG TPA: hypothetical protein VNB64_09800 [Solirubrobacteraceae bacterium]|nr:hypothetical protein [Solirubrobacteraceae bacterium]